MDVKQLILGPIVSEKSLSQRQNIYVFWVDIKATKGQIKQAIKEIFDVDVVKVNVAVKGQEHRRNLSTGKAYIVSRRKKAYVTIASGQKINLLEGK